MREWQGSEVLQDHAVEATRLCALESQVLTTRSLVDAPAGDEGVEAELLACTAPFNLPHTRNNRFGPQFQDGGL